MGEKKGRTIGSYIFCWYSEFLVCLAKIWYIPSISGHVLGISVLYPWIYVIDNVYTWLNMVHTCIHLVYTFNILYIIVYTCNIQGHTMYIHVYTMYIHLYARYILGHVYTMYMRVCTFRVLYMSRCTIGVHSTYYSICYEAMYRVHEGMYTNIPGGKDSRWSVIFSLDVPRHYIG